MEQLMNQILGFKQKEANKTIQVSIISLLQYLNNLNKNCLFVAAKTGSASWNGYPVKIRLMIVMMISIMMLHDLG